MCPFKNDPGHFQVWEGVEPKPMRNLTMCKQFSNIALGFAS